MTSLNDLCRCGHRMFEHYEEHVRCLGREWCTAPKTPCVTRCTACGCAQEIAPTDGVRLVWDRDHAIGSENTNDERSRS